MSMQGEFARAESLHGRIIAAPFDIAGIGRLAILEDPRGAMFGIMTPEGAR